MFRAIKQYDGSDSEKCIPLAPGDSLSAVHALDETWFIGFNERTKEIGAFPIECVETIGNEYEPMPAKDEEGQKLDEKAIYANVSKQIQARIKSEADARGDDDPILRSRTLSTHARTFDMNKMKATKPEKTFRLTLVKKDDEEEKPDAKHDDQKHQSIVNPEEVFTLPRKSNGNEDDKTAPRVTFSDVTLEHSISVADSTSSWQESFEMSYEGAQYARPADVIGKISKKEKSNTKEEDGKYHKLKRSSLQASKEKLFNKTLGIKSILIVMFVLISTVITLGVIYTVLLFSFGYTSIQAGVIVGVSALILSICCGLSSLCRCTMLLVSPNLLTYGGKTIWLCVLTGLILSYPLLNISRNLEETSQSLTCLTNLVEKQSKTLDRQLAQPFKDIVAYVDNQRSELKSVSHNIELALGNVEAHLQNFYGSLEKIDDFLITVVGECKQPFVNAVNYCATECTAQPSEPADVKSLCLQACSFMYKVSLKCDDIKDARRTEAINATAASARSAIDGVNNYFNVDVEATESISPRNNITQLSNATSRAVETDVDDRVSDFEIVIRFVQILLSFSICLMLFRPFIYIRSFLTIDRFDNVYISHEFQDKESESNKERSDFPLKQRETNVYISTVSIKPNPTEMNINKGLLVPVILHLSFSVAILLFDCALYHVLMESREYGKFEIAPDDEDRLKLNVTGNSQVAEFYRVMLQAVNLHKSFTMSLDIGSCLPNPESPNICALVAVIMFYILLIFIVVFGKYMNRLRRRIAANYYPGREIQRQEYLRQQICLERKLFTQTISQRAISYHRENVAKTKLMFDSKLARCLIFISIFKYVHKLKSVRCSGCQLKEHKPNLILTVCTGGHKNVPCEAMYCQNCKDDLRDECPICSKDSIYSTPKPITSITVISPNHDVETPASTS